MILELNKLDYPVSTYASGWISLMTQKMIYQTNSSTQSPATIIHTSISKQYSNLQTHYPELTDQQPAIISQKSK